MPDQVHCQQGSPTVTAFPPSPGTANANFVHRAYTFADHGPDLRAMVV
jgi:hypothetical protein